MRSISFIIGSCLLIIVGCSEPQPHTLYYVGHHYGDHPSWEYHTELEVTTNWDTVIYERKVFSRATIKNPAHPIETQHIMAVANSEGFCVVYDSLDYNWPGGDHTVKRKLAHGYEVDNNKTQKRIIPESQKTMVLTSYGAAELYLTHTDLHSNFEHDVYMLEDSLRMFRIKVLGTLSNGDYDIALYSLDGYNRREARFLVNQKTKAIEKREYVVHEKSEAYKSKSIGYEVRVEAGHHIDLGKIVSPNSSNYMEAGFSLLNQNKNPEKAIKLIDSALALAYNWPNVSAKLTALCHLKKEKEATVFIDSFLEDNRITMPQAYRIGRDLLLFQSQQQNDYKIPLMLFKKLSQKHPENPLPHFGLARVYSAQGRFGEAILALEQCNHLDSNGGFSKQIKENIERLQQRQPMI